MVVPLGGNFTVDSNMSSLMKGWYERYIFIVGRAEKLVPFIKVELGDHNLPNLLLCSSNLSDEQYLSVLVCRSHHFIVDLLLILPINDTSCVR